MTEIRRFDPISFNLMNQCSDGDYVLYADYESLATELDSLRANLSTRDTPSIPLPHLTNRETAK